MFAHYSFFPKVIRKLEKKTQFKIKAEREYFIDCFILDKYVTISCMVCKNLDEKICILSKKLP